MKSITRNTRKGGKVTQQKTNKRKKCNLQSQSSEYLKDVIYQSSPSSSSVDQYSQQLKFIKPQQKKQQPIQVSRQIEDPGVNIPVNIYEGSDYDNDSECGFNDATAQKSKRLNHSSIFQLHASKLSNQHAELQALNQTIDEPKQSEFSEIYLTKTPKMIIEMPKKQEKRGKDRKATDQPIIERPQRNGFQFVKLQNATNSLSQERRYPYRVSREVPPLKYWQGQKMDIKRNGYWRKSN